MKGRLNTNNVDDIFSTKVELQIVFCNLGNQVLTKLIFHYHVSAFVEYRYNLQPFQILMTFAIWSAILF